MTEDTPAADHIGPSDNAHRRVREVAEDLSAGKIVKPARDLLRKRLDAADKPDTGKTADGSHRAPSGGPLGSSGSNWLLFYREDSAGR